MNCRQVPIFRLFIIEHVYKLRRGERSGTNRVGKESGGIVENPGSLIVEHNT